MIKDYTLPDESGCPDNRDASLAVENLSFAYPGAVEPTIYNVSFTARAGDIVGVTGEVASGKTALGLALTGALPYAGSIRLCGAELSDFTQFERSRRVVYLGHDPQLLSDSILENVTLGGWGRFGHSAPCMLRRGPRRHARRGRRNAHRRGRRQALRRAAGQGRAGADARAQKQARHFGRPVFRRRHGYRAAHHPKSSGTTFRTASSFYCRIGLRCFPLTEKVLFFRNGQAVCSTHETLLDNDPAYRKLWDAQTKGGDEDEK